MKIWPNKGIAKRIAILVAVLVVGIGAWSTQWAAAQSISPTAPPPGGQAAPTINTSDQAQQKRGSLVIGAQSAGTCDFGAGSVNGCARLCLNTGLAVDQLGASVDTTVCIRSWRDLSSVVVGAYLQLASSPFGSFSASPGFTRLQGNAINPATGLPVANPYTIRAVSGTAIGSAALYADALQADNNAGYFWGPVVVGNDLTGAANSGRICLNSTKDKGSASAAEIANGTYCIHDWSEIASGATLDKLTLQSSSSPIAEAGSVNLDRTFAAGTYVIGDPAVWPASLSGLSCGDGICSVNETVGSCAIDCATVNPPAAVSGIAGIDFTSIRVTTGAQTGSPQVRVLIVRSNSATSTFQPVDGVIYPVGGDSSFAVVNSSVQPQNTVLPYINDIGNGLVSGQTYYYTIYQSNLYPRYASATQSITLTPLVGGSGSGCGIGGCGSDEPPLRPVIPIHGH